MTQIVGHLRSVSLMLTDLKTAHCLELNVVRFHERYILYIQSQLCISDKKNEYQWVTAKTLLTKGFWSAPLLNSGIWRSSADQKPLTSDFLDPKTAAWNFVKLVRYLGLNVLICNSKWSHNFLGILTLLNLELCCC